MKKLNEYLVTNFPGIWNSRLFYLLVFSFCTSVFFFLFIDSFDAEPGNLKPGDEGYYSQPERKDDDIFGYPALFLWGIFVFAWLYFQYHYDPFLRKYSFLEVFKGSLLNLLCLTLILIPLYPLFTLTLDDHSYLESVVDVFVVLVYIFVIPIIFLPFIIKSYSFAEIVLTIMATFFYGILIAFITFGLGLNEEILFLIGLFHYIFILIYIIVKLSISKYNTIDKSLIFILVAAAPWFVSFLIEPFMREEGGHPSPIPDASFHRHQEMYMIAILMSFFFLVILTWYVTKSLRKPMVIR